MAARSTKRAGAGPGATAIKAPTGNGSLTIRRISNGFVVNSTKVGRNGQYQQKETFVKKLPKLK